MSDLLVPPSGMVLGPDGLPVDSTQLDTPIGLNVYEAPDGDDILEATRKLAELRRRRERHGVLVIAPGQVTVDFMADCAIFNAEVRARTERTPRELTDAEREAIRAASKKRWMRGEKKRAQEARTLERRRAEAAARVRAAGERLFAKHEAEVVEYQSLEIPF